MGSCLNVKCLKNNLLLIFLAIAMALGIGAGFGIRKADPSFSEDSRRLMYLNFPGELLIRMLKMIVVPIIVCSLISGVANLPLDAMGRLGWRVIVYYMSTTFTAVLLGILLVTTIKPGSRGRRVERGDKDDPYVHPVDSLLDLIRNMFPSNLFQATFQQTRTMYKLETEMSQQIVDGNNVTVEKEVVASFKTQLGGSSNVLGLIVFSIALGLMIGRMREHGKPLRLFFDAFAEAIIRIVRIIIWYSPIGVFFLLAARIVSMDDPAVRFYQLAFYILTVLLGLGIHAFILLPGLYFILTRKNPVKFLFSMSQALLTALGTASSSATLPITMRCLEEKAEVSPIISRFVLPIGATINMDGTALYEAVASIFIAQYNDIHLSAGQIITVSVTATAAAIGAAGIPEAGLVTMLIVLTAVGLPTEDIALIYAVDWFLDRCRTMVNVWGDSIGAGIMDFTVGKYFRDVDKDTAKTDSDYMFTGEENGTGPKKLKLADEPGFTHDGEHIDARF